MRLLSLKLGEGTALSQKILVRLPALFDPGECALRKLSTLEIREGQRASELLSIAPIFMQQKRRDKQLLLGSSEDLIIKGSLWGDSNFRIISPANA